MSFGVHHKAVMISSSLTPHQLKRKTIDSFTDTHTCTCAHVHVIYTYIHEKREALIEGLPTLLQCDYQQLHCA